MGRPQQLGAEIGAELVEAVRQLATVAFEQSPARQRHPVAVDAVALDPDNDVALLHMLADASVSVGVVIAGILILLTGIHWIDPLVSLLINIVIVAGTWSLLRDATNLALDAVPAGIDPMAVRAYLEKLPGVTSVNDLHIWALSTTRTALTAHLVRPGAAPTDELLARAFVELREYHGIEHATIQIERGDGAHPCALESDETV